MERLIKGTVAYKILLGDRLGGRLSHAYMLHFPDAANLRAALRIFALALFGADRDSRDGRLILSEGLPDMRVYPPVGQKLAVAQATEIIDDAAIRPVERGIKLYIISDFDGASPIFQNKLLKVLEEPPEGVYFLLGAATLAPVLDTVKSRVRLLEIPPFTAEEIYAALERGGHDERNGEISRAAGGILGNAQKMLGGGWFERVHSAAKELCAAGDINSALAAAVRYSGIAEKSELLAEMQRLYFAELKKYAEDENYRAPLCAGALITATECADRAQRDLKFNANFAALLSDVVLKVATENARWLKL